MKNILSSENPATVVVYKKLGMCLISLIILFCHRIFESKVSDLSGNLYVAEFLEITGKCVLLPYV